MKIYCTARFETENNSRQRIKRMYLFSENNSACIRQFEENLPTHR